MRNCIEYVLRQDKTSEPLTYVTGPYRHDEIIYDLVYRTFLEEKKLWDKADRLYFTVVHQECEGDTVIPSVDPEVWREVAREVGKADEKNECDYTFINYERVK